MLAILPFASFRQRRTSTDTQADRWYNGTDDKDRNVHYNDDDDGSEGATGIVDKQVSVFAQDKRSTCSRFSRVEDAMRWEERAGSDGRLLGQVESACIVYKSYYSILHARNYRS